MKIKSFFKKASDKMFALQMFILAALFSVHAKAAEAQIGRAHV